MSVLRGKRLWVALGLAVVVVAVAVGIAIRQAGNAPGADSRGDACAEVQQPASDTRPDWIDVSGSSPQAAGQLVSTLSIPYRDPTVSLKPDTALLVHPIRMHTGSDVNDCPHFVVAERDASGHVAAIADYVYDYPHARVRLSNVGMIPPSDPRYDAPYPYLTESAAAALVTSSRHVGVKSDPAPELVFLPLDMGLPGHPGKAEGWRGGGAWPTDPIWLVAGPDGQDYFVGTDQHVYTIDEIPLS